jgi:hypothetical protein
MARREAWRYPFSYRSNISKPVDPDHEHVRKPDELSKEQSQEPLLWFVKDR